MEMKRRFALYGFGFALGLILVFFFLGGKKASCNWLPNDRILNIIQQKEVSFSPEVWADLPGIGADSTDIYSILRTGDVDFSKSRVKNEPCRQYWIRGTRRQRNLQITVEVCDSTALVKTISRKPVQ